MRKFAINFFALDYVVRVFEKTYSWTRSANIIFPIIILCGLSTIFAPTFLWVLIPILAIAAFFGFAYFLMWPLTDDDIKYMSQTQLFKYCVRHNMDAKAITKYDNSCVFWVNIAFIALFLLTYAILQ